MRAVSTERTFDRGWRLSSLAIALALIGLFAGFLAARSSTKAKLDSAPLEILSRRLPDMQLWDHEGKAHTLHDLVRNKVIAINFAYTACSRTCTLATQNLLLLQDLLTDDIGRRVSIYSITIDPEHDSPDVLKRHREAIGARDGWMFLTTGSREAADQLRRNFGISDPDPEADQDYATHTGMVIIGNESEGRWSMVPALLDPKRLRQAIERVALPPALRAKGDSVVSAVTRTYSDASLVPDKR